MQDGLLIVHFKEYSGTIIFGILLTLTWSFLWPTWIRDDEGQRLPRSTLARATFALSIGILYIGLVSMAFLAPAFFSGLSSPSVQVIAQYIENLSGGAFNAEAYLKRAPFGMIILMGILYSIPQVKEIFERWAYFLHASQYSKSDEKALLEHLQRCEFQISDSEIGLNQDYIEQFDIYVIDDDARIIKDRTLDIWRKVSALLRFVRRDLDNDEPVLGDREREEFVALEEAHRRKTQLAMNIIRVLDQMDQSNDEGRRVVRIASTLTDASHKDRDSVVEAEEIARQIAGAEKDIYQAQSIKGPVRLSSRQLGEYLGQIGSYFFKEYQIILKDVSRLAAKSIVRAGDEAPVRLDTARYVGFMGLGQIEQQSFDSVLWTLMMTWATVVGSFIAASFAMGRQMQPALIFSIALTVAIATTIGSLWASRRALVEKRVTPWSSYLLAGVLSVTVFCVVHSFRFSWDPQAVLARIIERHPEAAGWTAVDYLFQILPFSVGLVFLTAGICRLARESGWSWAKHSNLYERMTDGVLLGLIYAAGGIAALSLHYATGTAFGEQLREAFAAGSWRMLLMIGVNGLIGLIIGAAVVRDVRRIAHSHFIEKPAQHAERHPETAREVGLLPAR